MDKQEFINMIAANVKPNQWLNGTFDVNGKRIGIKAYGKWVQRMQVSGCSFYVDVTECKTHKEFRVKLAEALTACGIPD